MSKFNIKFTTYNGTTAQYVRGNGTIANFPSVPNFQKGVSIVQAVVANSTPSVVGCPVPIGTGTAFGVSPTMDSLYNSKKIMEYLATSGASSVAGWRWLSEPVILGATSVYGGFSFTTSFGFADGFVTNPLSRVFFCGLTNTIAISSGTLNPSTLINLFGFALDSGDANFQFIHNDNTGTATKVDLGSGLARPTANKANFYQVSINAIAGSGVVQYAITDLLSGNTASGQVSTNIPLLTETLAPRCYIGAGANASAVGLGFESIYLES